MTALLPPSTAAGQAGRPCHAAAPPILCRRLNPRAVRLARVSWTACALAAAMLLLRLPAPHRAQAQQRITLDESAIIVNNKAMTRREVAAVREQRLKELQAHAKGDDLAQQTKALNATLIDQLVENLLIESRADELGISVSDKEIDQRVDSIVRRDPTVMDIYSEAQLKDYIYKDSLRRQVIQREVNTRVRVEEEDIQRACRQETRDNREIDVGHILIRGHDAAAQEKIRAIHKQLMDGADFELTASTYSEDPSAATNHGRLGFVSRGQFVKEFDDVAFSLAPGQVSEPVQTQFGYHLIKVFGERKKAGVDCDHLDDANRQRIYTRLFSAAAETQMKEFMDRLRKRADIQVNIQ